MPNILSLETNKYAIKIDNFEGPLDLLLHLVRTSKMDIYTINIRDLIDEYIADGKTKIYKNEDYSSNSSTNLVTNENTIVEKDEDGTYFKTITLSKEELYYSTPKTNNYTLLIYYTKESANAKYQNTIESIRIVVDSNQIVDS